MTLTDTQRLLLATTYYTGGLDGDIGKLSKDAIEIIERTQSDQYPKGYERWGWKRRTLAAGQAILNVYGFEAGGVDGLVGHNTKEAFRGWAYKQATGKKETVSRPAIKKYQPSSAVRRKLPTQAQCPSFYGSTKAEVERNLVTIRLPFEVRIDWNLSQRTRNIRVHRKCAPSLRAALIEIYEHYGEKEYRRLGVDRFAGSFNWRRMRGGRKLSMHSFGCATDWFAAPNGLRVSCPQALFCKKEYEPFLDIMEKHGWLPAIRLWGKDAMHFQRARLR